LLRDFYSVLRDIEKINNAITCHFEKNKFSSLTGGVTAGSYEKIIISSTFQYSHKKLDTNF